MMELVVESSPTGVSVRVSGEVDLETSPQLRATLLEQVCANVQLNVNLRQVSYIDSSGIASLVETLQKCRSVGGALRLSQLSPSVGKVLSLARLDQVFEIDG